MLRTLTTDSRKAIDLAQQANALRQVAQSQIRHARARLQQTMFNVEMSLAIRFNKRVVEERKSVLDDLHAQTTGVQKMLAREQWEDLLRST